MSDTIGTTTKLVYRDIAYGFHVQKHKTLLKTVQEVPDVFGAFQVYIASGRSYAPPTCEIPDILAAGELLIERGLWMCVHSCLLYNPAGKVTGPTDPKYDTALELTRKGLATELDIVAGMGGGGVVVHIGAEKNRERGLKTIAETVVNVLRRRTSYTVPLAKALGISTTDLRMRRYVLLENSASEGNKLGGTLEDIRVIYSHIPTKYHGRVGVCIDTAHGFGAGQWDWGAPGEIKRFYREFEELVGLEYLKVFHLNDSMISSTSKGKNAPYGSRKDRHECLCLGYIFGPDDRALRLKEFFQLAAKHGIPCIGEPPGGGVSELGVAEGNPPLPRLGGKGDFVIACSLLGSDFFYKVVELTR